MQILSQFVLTKPMTKKRGLHLGIKYLPNLIFISFLGIIYIANSYFAERKINQISTLQNDIEHLNIEYNTLKYQYTQKTSYDTIKRLVEPLGLIENDSQLILIEIE